MYEKTLEREYQRAKKVPLTRIAYEGSEIVLFRADQLAAGVKTAIGRALVALAIDRGQITHKTRALVVQGAGNTVTAVHEAVQERRRRLEVIAVVYEETSRRVRDRLLARGIRVVSGPTRSQGQEGRKGTVLELWRDNPAYVPLEQHEEPLIVDIQCQTLGLRIDEELENDGTPPTHLVAGVGTGGTLFGLSYGARQLYPGIKIIGLEGVGSTLSLWHAYLRVKGQGFEKERAAIERALVQYRNAGMVTKLTCFPEADPDGWFDITVDFPADMSGTLGIEGLGVGNPTKLILKHLRKLTRVEIITDEQAAQGVLALSKHGISAVESAGANMFIAMRIAERQAQRGQAGAKIVTVVTAAR
ncbi:MAG TPA: hypothetical protein DCY48_03510 [Candidatus Magasanikbacteria bacterium]|nr:MAG: hypothetical protein A3I74_04045 [Candidatus Magasanikbacteria bacterium RIFCSPLOWO2_02_FULL_47_16]OGH79332.1 MAG: hypothetical protein A3C10_04585 [Candidatus Magasanikbacteria bacterium RIFCSPHIGHO2_02_FULL_48_18]HAZ28811.1 hypothetical protein [Candidatus Magasanikbacteria bacterium]